MYQASIDRRDDRPGSFVLLLPLLFVLTGTLIRFLAFRYAQPDAAWTGYFGALCRWDCGWYVTMAQTGYDGFPVPGRVSAGNWAFFPFYPMLVGVIGKLVPLPTIVLASLLSILTAYAAVVAAWPLLGRNIRAYALYACFILSGPLSMYFTTFFTEVMFVLLTTLAFRYLGRGNYLAAAGFTALLSATRIVGVFVSLSIGLQALLDWRRTTGSWKGWLAGLLGQPRLVLAIFVAPLGLFAYMAFLHYWIGSGLATAMARRAVRPARHHHSARCGSGLHAALHGGHGAAHHHADDAAGALALAVRRQPAGPAGRRLVCDPGLVGRQCCACLNATLWPLAPMRWPRSSPCSNSLFSGRPCTPGYRTTIAPITSTAPRPASPSR